MIVDQWRGWSPRQRARVVLVSVVAVVVLVTLYKARGALLPFVLGLGLAYLALPSVDWLEDHAPALLRRLKLARPLAIVVVYVAALGLIVGFFAYLVPVIIRQVEQLIAQRGQIIETVRVQFFALREWYLTTIPLQVQAAIEARLQDAGASLLKMLQSGIVGGLALVTNTVSLILGYLVIPFWLFFVLHDARAYRRMAYSLIPESLRPDVSNVARIVDHVLSGYLRGQLIVASATGLLTTIALTIIGVEFAVLLGFVVAVLDLIPTFGPIIALVPVTLIAAVGRPINALWAVIALIAVQQIENVLIGPRIVGESVRVPPALLMVLLVIGNQLGGVLGLVIIVPLAAVARDVIRYIYARTGADGLTPAESLAAACKGLPRRTAREAAQPAVEEPAGDAASGSGPGAEL